MMNRLATFSLAIAHADGASPEAPAAPFFADGIQRYPLQVTLQKSDGLALSASEIASLQIVAVDEDLAAAALPEAWTQSAARADGADQFTLTLRSNAVGSVELMARVVLDDGTVYASQMNTDRATFASTVTLYASPVALSNFTIAFKTAGGSPDEQGTPLFGNGISQCPLLITVVKNNGQPLSAREISTLAIVGVDSALDTAALPEGWTHTPVKRVGPRQFATAVSTSRHGRAALMARIVLDDGSVYASAMNTSDATFDSVVNVTAKIVTMSTFTVSFLTADGGTTQTQPVPLYSTGEPPCPIRVTAIKSDGQPLSASEIASLHLSSIGKYNLPSGWTQTMKPGGGPSQFTFDVTSVKSGTVAAMAIISLDNGGGDRVSLESLDARFVTIQISDFYTLDLFEIDYSFNTSLTGQQGFMLYANNRQQYPLRISIRKIDSDGNKQLLSSQEIASLQIVAASPNLNATSMPTFWRQSSTCDDYDFGTPPGTFPRSLPMNDASDAVARAEATPTAEAPALPTITPTPVSQTSNGVAQEFIRYVAASHEGSASLMARIVLDNGHIYATQMSTVYDGTPVVFTSSLYVQASRPYTITGATLGAPTVYQVYSDQNPTGMPPTPASVTVSSYTWFLPYGLRSKTMSIQYSLDSNRLYRFPIGSNGKDYNTAFIFPFDGGGFNSPAYVSSFYGCTHNNDTFMILSWSHVITALYKYETNCSIGQEPGTAVVTIIDNFGCQHQFTFSAIDSQGSGVKVS